MRLRRAQLFGAFAVLALWSQPVFSQDDDLIERLPPVERVYGGAVPLVESQPQIMREIGMRDLAREVEELREALRKIQDKEAAAKKKAAGYPTVTVGGRIHWDNAAFSQNAASLAQAGDMKNGEEFRRARLQAQGEAFENIDYKVQFDFAGTGQPAFKDVYMTLKYLPLLGNIRVGEFWECYALEVQTSSNYITFMERSLIGQSGGLGNIGDRKPGLKVFNCSDSLNATWAVGVFAWQATERPPAFPGATFYDDKNGTAFDCRYTFLPWYDEATDGRSMMHCGLSYTYRTVAALDPKAPAGTIRYAVTAKPESNMARLVADTGNLPNADHINGFNPEFAWVYGPLSIQSEYKWMWIGQTGAPDLTFNGGYAYVSYFLTGENRTYDRKYAGFFRVRPYENFFRVHADDGSTKTGTGAWEIGYRWSFLNLTNDGIRGGLVTDHTFGLNWYLNPFTRIMFNYIHSTTTQRGKFGPGNVDIVQTRCQFDF